MILLMGNITLYESNQSPYVMLLMSKLITHVVNFYDNPLSCFGCAPSASQNTYEGQQEVVPF